MQGLIATGDTFLKNTVGAIMNSNAWTGNSVIFITDLGVVIVDSKLAGWGQPLIAKIKTITDKPVATIINTHAHGDHVGGNEFFGTAVEVTTSELSIELTFPADAATAEALRNLPRR